MPQDENKTSADSRSAPVMANKQEEPEISSPQAEEISASVETIEQPQTQKTAENEPIVSTEKTQTETPEPSSVAKAVEDKQPKTETPTQPEKQPQERIIYKTDPNIILKLLIKARAKIQERKQKKLDKIMTLFETNPQVTNKDMQKLLRISSATAVRYLDILEKENRIKQVGKTGKAVFYSKI